ncbi:MAG TPA: Wzz/FepE/Etk N-terminal domain-containing protein [Gemmatimonadales bacterium]|nr:Wzz/FepE/Etk N-terminal domain-containing protein [Gemmatimonadales bacterium]
MTPATEPRDTEGLPLRRTLDTIWRQRRLMGALALVLAIITAVVTLILPRSYTSITTFMPQASQGKFAQLSGLAAEFGFNVSANEPAASPSFYAFLLQSRELLRSAVRTTFDLPAKDTTRRATLVEWYHPTGDTPAEREDEAIDHLRRDLRAATDGETGTVQLKVRNRSPRLAFEINSRLMDLVSDFNLQKRQSQAAAERRFVESQVKEAAGRLQAAEDRLKGFLQQNREYRTSPQLLFEYDRLFRAVTMQQGVYSSLAQAFEQARIDEVRNTPVLTLVDPPNLPAEPDRRWLLAKALLAALLGAMIGAFVALVRDFLGRTGGEARLPAAGHEPESPLARAAGLRTM